MRATPMYGAGDVRVEPGKVFDRTITLDDIRPAYRALADREALKILVRP